MIIWLGILVSSYLKKSELILIIAKKSYMEQSSQKGNYSSAVVFIKKLTFILLQ